jgi:hypothetical protein
MTSLRSRTRSDCLPPTAPQLLLSNRIFSEVAMPAKVHTIDQYG